MKAFADAVFFEDWADDEGRASGGEEEGEEALGLAPVDAGEVGERGAAGDADGGELVGWCMSARARSKRCWRSASVIGTWLRWCGS